MNKKVEELIERVRLTPKEIGKIIEDIPKKEWNPLNLVNSIAQAQLNKVLNDGDLALIDREIPRTGLEQDAEWTKRLKDCRERCLASLRLTEKQKGAECQERVERILGEFEKEWFYKEHRHEDKTLQSGEKDYFELTISPESWQEFKRQALKKKEGVE